MCSKYCTRLCARAASHYSRPEIPRRPPEPRQVRSLRMYFFRLDFPPSFHRFQHGDFIGVLNVAADGDAHRDARNPEALPP